MKCGILYLIYICAMLTACHRHHSEEAAPLWKAETGERTVIIYMMAENSMDEYTSLDIEEMVATKSEIPDSVHYVIYKDDTDLPIIQYITDSTGLQDYYVFPQDHYSTDSVQMLQNLRFIIDAFPARHYTLVFWSHASGWIPRHKTLGIDNGQNNRFDTGHRMNISELRWTLQQLPHTDMLFFDACFMQNIEVAYELRHVTDWIVGSPAEIPGPGAPYNKIMKGLCDGDAQAVTLAYSAEYPNTRRDVYKGVVLSAIRCSELDNLAQACKEFIPQSFVDRAEVPTHGVQSYCDYYNSGTYHFDMGSFFYHLLEEDDYLRWKEAYTAAVPCRPAATRWFARRKSFAVIEDTLHNGAVSMFLPDAVDKPGWNTLFHETEWYHASGWDETGW